MPLYQLCFALRPNTDEEVIKAIRDRIGVFVGERGGRIEEVEEFGKKPLSYEVEGEEEGIFIRVFFTLENPSSLDELTRWMRAQNEVIRLILIKMKKPLTREEKKIKEKKAHVK